MPARSGWTAWCRAFLVVAGLSLISEPFAWTAAAAAQGATEVRSPHRAPASGPLRVHPGNPRYFADATGKAVLLTGSHTWNNLQDMGPTDPPEPFEFGQYLDFLDRHHHNFIRLWRWELVKWNTEANREKNPQIHHCAPHPWARSGPGMALDGKPRFDLTQWNPAYFERLRSRVLAARDRGIYVGIMLFEGWGPQFVQDAWKAHPFHPENSVQGVQVDRDGDGKALELHQLALPEVTAWQEAYVRKVIDTVNDLDNVLYEISNENHPPSTAWQYHFIRFIKDYERGKPRQHPVGMTFQYRGGRNADLFESPADWVSPNPDAAGAFNYRDNPPPADGSKVILSDTDHLWGIGGDVHWVWKTFTRGLHPLFMDPYDHRVLSREPDSRWAGVRSAQGVALRLSEKLDLAGLTPSPERSSTGYCLSGDTDLIVLVPGGGDVRVDLTRNEGSYRVTWMHPATGATRDGGTTEGGAERSLTCPTAGDAVVWLSRRRDP